MHLVELEWIQWLQHFRTPALDFFFHSLRFFDRPEFIFVLVPVVWLNCGWKNGLRIFYIVFFNALFNSFLKDLFASPRPCVIAPQLGLFSIEGYGFPSGAAQQAMLLAGLFVTFSKRPGKWLIVVPYVLLVSLSRVYLGVHFPSDILGGWIAGLVMLFVVLYFMPRIEKILASVAVYKLLSLHLFVIITLAISCSMYAASAYIGSSIGFAIGLWLCIRWKIQLPVSRRVKDYLLRSIVGVVGVFLLYMMMPGSVLLQALLSGLWISFFATLLIRQKNFLKKE